MNRNDFQASNNPNVSSFVVPLAYDVNTNQTTLWDRVFKHQLMGNELRYQNISKILNNSRDNISKCTFYFSF